MGKENLEKLAGSVRYAEPTGIEIDGETDEEKYTKQILQEVAVDPRGDGEIAALPVEQRLTEVRKWLRAYERPLVESLFKDDPEHRLEDSIHLTELIAGTELKEWELNYRRNRYEEKKKAYFDEKQAINIGEKGKRGKSRKQKNLRLEWEVEKENLSQTVVVQESLYVATLDVFLQDFILSPDGISRLRLAVADLEYQNIVVGDPNNRLRSQGINIRHQVADLIQRASERIRNLDNQQEVAHLAYKPTQITNFINIEEARPLRNLIELVCSVDHPEGCIDQSLNQLAQGLLEFYWENPETALGTEETFPRWAVLHDFLFAVASIGNRRVFAQLGSWLRPHFEPERERFVNEEKEMFPLCASEQKMAYLKLNHDYFSDKDPSRSDMTNWLTTRSMNYIRENWLPEEKRFIIGQNYDRAAGLEAAFTLLGWRELTEIKTKRTRELRSVFEESTDPTETIGEYVRMPDTILLWKVYLTHAIRRQYQTLDVLMSNIFTADEFFRQRAVLVRSNVQEIRRQFEDIGPKLTHLSEASSPELVEDALVNSFVASSMLEVVPKNLEENEELDRRVQELIRQTRDFNIWFVAPWGDEFEVDVDSGRNMELLSRQIRSITFWPDPDCPRAHKVRIISTHQLENEPFSFELTLDDNGKLLDNDGTIFPLTLWQKLPFVHLLLTRLEYITSGRSGTGDEEPGEIRVGDKTREREVKEVVRRSHYRILTSTPDRKYTLQSKEAEKHRIEIEVLYGIKIWEEITRRRAVGSLKPNQVLTYVKATIASKPIPNQLVYREE